MANKEYLKILKYGEWLEKFLDKNIKSWRLQELLEEAVNTLKIEGLDKEVFQSDAFNNLEALEKFLQTNVDIQVDHSDSASDAFIESEGKDQKAEFREDFIKPKIHTTELPKGDITILPQRDSKELQKTVDFFSIRRKTIGLFKEVLKSNRPWEHFFSLNRFNRNYPIDTLLQSYNGLIERFYLENNKFTKKAELISKTSMDLWLTTFSIISIGFLNLGGQEYYGFCDHCDKFYLVQRKGKKKYCSDVCRAMAFKEKKFT